MPKVLDMFGVRLHKYQIVLVHQEDGCRVAVVVDDFDENPETLNFHGFWVDIDKGKGPEGMMSYILEVIDGN